MIIREVRKSDIPALVKLHRKTAETPNGVARTPGEIDEKGINFFVENSLQKGICLVMENPQNSQELIAELHCFKHEPVAFHHTLGNLTLVVHPDFHGQGLGKKIFSHLLEEVQKNHPEILRVELSARDNNPRALRLYQSLGFKIEGVMEKRILDAEGNLSGDVMMAWMNPRFKGSI